MLVAVLATLALPASLRNSLYYFIVFLSLVVLSGCTALADASSPADPLPRVLILAVELTASAWLVYLAHNLSLAIQKSEASEKVLRAMAVEDPSLDMQQALTQIHIEMTRSRHYERPLSVVLVDAAELLASEAFLEKGEPIPKGIDGPYACARLAKFIQRELPPMVLFVRDPDHHKVILVCPEISAENVYEVTGHLSATIYRDFGVRPKFGSASFPDHGVSFEALYQYAAADLEQQTRKAREGEPASIRPEREKQDAVYANK
jgi:hypothetical protein